MIAIWDPDRRATSAIAELAGHVRSASSPDGALAVVDGRLSWPVLAAAAADAGAIAVIVVDPRAVEGIEQIVDVAQRVPTVLDRSRVRADRVLDDTAPAYVTASVAAGRSAAPGALIDAVGWVRRLGRGPLDVRSAHSTNRGAIALADVGGVPVTATVTVLAGAAADVRFDVLSVGVDRCEISLDPAGEPVVTVVTEGGSTRSPRLWESARRASIRRTIEAIETGARPTDAVDLLHDVAVAEAMLSHHLRRLAT